jgi:hypothetical protein
VFGNKNWEQQEQYEKNILTIIKRLPFFLKISSSNNLVEEIIPFFLEDLHLISMVFGSFLPEKNSTNDPK